MLVQQGNHRTTYVSLKTHRANLRGETHSRTVLHLWYANWSRVKQHKLSCICQYPSVSVNNIRLWRHFSWEWIMNRSSVTEKGRALPKMHEQREINFRPMRKSCLPISQIPRGFHNKVVISAVTDLTTEQSSIWARVRLSKCSSCISLGN